MSGLASALQLSPPATVSVIGSGGKTTIIEALARELHAAGHSVIVSTTTHFLRPPLPTLEGSWPPRPFLAAALGPETEEPGKFQGPPLELLEALRERCDFLLLEADGARGKSLKGYRDGEPVVPRWTDRVLVVVGADILGRSDVHRPEVLQERLGWEPGHRVSPIDLVEAVFHPDQYFRGIEGGTLIVNKVADAAPALEFLGRSAMLGLLHMEVPQALMRYMDGTVEKIWPTWKPGGTCILLLAAGRSERMETFKPLHPLHGQPLLQHALDRCVASQAPRVVAVLGHRADELLSALVPRHPKLEFLVHDRYDEGMSASIVQGLRRVPPDARRVAVALGDMPFIRTETVDRLLDTEHDGIVVPTCGGRRGHPVLFATRFIGDLRGLRGDHGAASVLQAHASAVLEVPVDDEGILRDIDRMEDLS